MRSGRRARQTSARSAAASSPSSAPAASRPTIGIVGTPVSAWSSAARRSATAIGPPAPNPARSALFSTISVGISPIIARSSGFSASATTTTATSASSAPVMTTSLAGQRCRHGGPADAVTPPDVDPNRAAKPAGERTYPRITCTFTEPRQLVGENLMAFPNRRLAHVSAPHRKWWHLCGPCASACFGGPDHIS